MQDGFLTTHTVEKVRLPEPEFMKEYIGKPEDKLFNLMDPENPMMSGVVQNQDSYMKGKIAQRWYYDRVGPALEEAFELFAEKTGRKYDFVMPYRCEDAELHHRRHGLLHGDGAADGRLPAQDQGHSGRLPERLLLPAVPGAGRLSKPSRIARRSPSWSGWTTRSPRRATI